MKALVDVVEVSDCGSGSKTRRSERRSCGCECAVGDCGGERGSDCVSVVMVVVVVVMVVVAKDCGGAAVREVAGW